MARLETVVHTTRSSRQAEGLRDALKAAGIDARVNDTTSAGEPATAAEAAEIQVLVAEQDALVARQIVGDFASGGLAGPATSGDRGSEPSDSGSLPGWWPKCPGCEAPRSTSCPICGTSGTRFEAIDMGFSLIEGVDDAAAAAGSSCGPGGCGPGGCSTGGEAGSAGGALTLLDPAPSDGDDDGEHEAEMAAGMVICPTCDEPFEPQHPKLCEWCNHEFPDGFETPLAGDASDHDDFTGRVYLVVGLLLAMAVAAAVYFGYTAY